MKIVETVSGLKFVRPTTSVEENALRIDKAYDRRLKELRIRAVIRLRRQGIKAIEADITQIGCEGFHYVMGREVIPTFEYFRPQTRKENRRIFNGRT